MVVTWNRCGLLAEALRPSSARPAPLTAWWSSTTRPPTVPATCWRRFAGIEVVRTTAQLRRRGRLRARYPAGPGVRRHRPRLAAGRRHGAASRKRSRGWSPPVALPGSPAGPDGQPRRVDRRAAASDEHAPVASPAPAGPTGVALSAAGACRSARRPSSRCSSTRRSCAPAACRSPTTSCGTTTSSSRRGSSGQRRAGLPGVGRRPQDGSFGSTDVDPGGRFYYEVRNKVWLFTRSRGLSPLEKIGYGGATLASAGPARSPARRSGARWPRGCCAAWQTVFPRPAPRRHRRSARERGQPGSRPASDTVSGSR